MSFRFDCVTNVMKIFLRIIVLNNASYSSGEDFKPIGPLRHLCGLGWKCSGYVSHLFICINYYMHGFWVPFLCASLLLRIKHGHLINIRRTQQTSICKDNIIVIQQVVWLCVVWYCIFYDTCTWSNISFFIHTII